MKVKIIAMSAAVLLLAVFTDRAQSAGAQAQRAGAQQSLFARLDTNGDGVISRQEFQAYERALRTAAQKASAQKQLAPPKAAPKKSVPARTASAGEKKTAREKKAAQPQYQRQRGQVPPGRPVPQGRRLGAARRAQARPQAGVRYGAARPGMRMGRRMLGAGMQRQGIPRRCPVCGRVMPQLQRPLRRGAISPARQGRAGVSGPAQRQGAGLQRRGQIAPGAAGRQGAPAQQKRAPGVQRRRGQEEMQMPAPVRPEFRRQRGVTRGASAAEPADLASDQDVLDNWQLLADLGLLR